MADTKIVREMASFEVLHTENNSSGSFPSGEYSFLPEVSAGPLQNGVVNHSNHSFDMTNMQSALSSATSDLSVEEIHSRLIELLEENQTLKEALNKNNTMMKDQMKIISAWREQMLFSKTQQQQNLEKAREKILHLEKENVDLHDKVIGLEKKCQDLLDRESCSKCNNLEAAVQNLQEENCILQRNKNILANELKEINQFQEQLQQTLLVANRCLEKLVRTSKLTENEKEELNDVILCLKFKMTAYGDFCATVQTDEETGYEVVNKKIHEAEVAEDHFIQNSSEIVELKKELEEKNKELDLLKKQGEEMNGTIKGYEKKLQENELALKSRYEVMDNKLSIESSLAGKYKERCESLQHQVDDYQEKMEKAKVSDCHLVEQLRDDAKNLQDILKLEQLANQKDKDKLADVMLKCEELQVDYDRVTQLLEIQAKDEKKKNEELSTMQEADAKQHMEELDHLTAQLYDVQQQLDEKEEEIRKLTEQLSTVEKESENIPIFKAQIEVYKTDLEQAVSTRDSAHKEIEMLERELNKYKRQESGASFSLSKRNGCSRKEQSTPSTFECPICLVVFTELKAAENHINRCADKSACNFV